MYKIIKSVIIAGNFKLSDMTNKINTLWVTGELNDEQRDELLQLMNDHLNPATEAPELSERINRVEQRVTILEDAVKELQSDGGETTEPDPEEVIIPQWEPWDGVSNDYQYGAVVTHNEKYWHNVLQGTQNTWEPGAEGVGENIWKEITKEEAEVLLTPTTGEEPNEDESAEGGTVEEGTVEEGTTQGEPTEDTAVGDETTVETV